MSWARARASARSAFSPRARGQRAGDLRDLERMGKPAAEVISGRDVGETGKDLGLAGQAAKGASVQNARAVAGERRAIGVRRFGKGALRKWRRVCARRQLPAAEQATPIGFGCHHRSRGPTFPVIPCRGCAE